MRILFAHQVNDLYGASRSLLRLARRLRQEGHAVWVVLPVDGPLASKLADSGVAIQILPAMAFLDRQLLRTVGARGLVRRLIASVPQLLRLIRDQRIDLVHTNTALVLSSSLAARLARRPHIWHVREIFADAPRLWKPYRRLMLGLADRILCVSHAVAAQFEGAAGSQKVLVLHNGIPAAETRYVPPEDALLHRSRLGIQGGPVVATLGRINLRRKGQGVFVEAAKRLVRDFPQARFLIAGSPFPGKDDNLVELQHRIHALGLEESVIWIGELEHPEVVYHASDVTVLAACMPDSFPGVVVESMAMGRPVVATRLGGAVEQIADGETGFLVPPEDPEALAGALRRLLANPALCAEMGRRARQRFLELFEFERFYQSMTGIYAQLTAAASSLRVDKAEPRRSAAPRLEAETGRRFDPHPVRPATH